MIARRLSRAVAAGLSSTIASHCAAPTVCLVLPALFLGAGAPSFGTVASADKRYTKGEAPLDSGAPAWSISFKKGEISLHRRTTKFIERGSDRQDTTRMELRSVERTEIKDVNARGEATAVTTCISMHRIVSGQAEPIDAVGFPPSTRVFGRNGLLLREIDAPEIGADPAARADKLLLNRPTPPEPPEIGAVWRTDLTDPGKPGKRITMVSRFLGPTTLIKIPSVKVASAFDVDPTPPRTMPIRVKCDSTIDPTDGHILYSIARISNVVFVSHGRAVTGDIDIVEELIVPGSNDGGAQAPPH